MDFTFGIVTAGTADDFIEQTIDSIEELKIPRYEVLIVGNSKVDRKNTTVMPFDESIRAGWTTRKKNIITSFAKYENVVYAHDYIKYESDWYEGYRKFGNDFLICMNRIHTAENERWRDWVIWPWNGNTMDQYFMVMDPNDVPPSMIPYDVTHLTNYQYISGAYWVAKKDIMLRFPLDNSRAWGQDEDTEWSFRTRRHIQYSMNPHSTVKFLKSHTKGPNGHSDSYRITPPELMESILREFPRP